MVQAKKAQAQKEYKKAQAKKVQAKKVQVIKLQPKRYMQEVAGMQTVILEHTPAHWTCRCNHSLTSTTQ